MINEEVKKVLFIRTIQADLLGTLIAQWKGVYPNAAFDILTHHSQSNVSYYSTMFDNIYTYNANADFSWNKLSDELKKELSGKYDVILFAHKWDSVAGFANVIKLASNLKPRQIAHSTAAGEVKVLTGNQSLKRIEENILTVLFLLLFGLPALIVSGISALVFLVKRQKKNDSGSGRR
jgi:hypothetical protein